MQTESFSRLVLKNIATLGFIGYLPVAPGTFGSLAAFLLFVIFKPSIPAQILLLLVVIPAGIVASHHAEKLLKDKDSRHIVIDEFAGCALSVLLIPPSLPYYAAGFFLFRFLDILKPPPVKSMESIFHGGIGVMADDLMAGICANLILQAWILLR